MPQVYCSTCKQEFKNSQAYAGHKKKCKDFVIYEPYHAGFFQGSLMYLDHFSIWSLIDYAYFVARFFIRRPCLATIAGIISYTVGFAFYAFVSVRLP